MKPQPTPRRDETRRDTAMRNRSNQGREVLDLARRKVRALADRAKHLTTEGTDK